MHNRPFIPETQPFYPEATICDLALSCHKKENHKKYKAINELTTDHLPEKWRNEKVLHDLKVDQLKSIRNCKKHFKICR